MSDTVCNVCRAPVRGAAEFLCPKHMNAVRPFLMERYRRAAAAVMQNRAYKQREKIYPIRADDHLFDRLAAAYKACREDIGPIPVKE